MNLRTNYMGLDLAHPVLASASPLCRKLDSLRAMEDAGAAAVVLHSLFEEQIVREREAMEHFTALGSHSDPEAQAFFPAPKLYVRETDAYLEHLQKARAALGIPVIASLNGTSDAGWTDYARQLESAGAAALELNLYHVACDPEQSGAELEQRDQAVVRGVRARIAIPLAVKLSPYYSSMAHVARGLAEAGADALVLFNRFYQPDFDIERMAVVSSLRLSESDEMQLPLRWIGLLRGRVKCQLAASTGAHTPADVVKYLMAGADVVMSTSALLKQGIGHLGVLRDGLAAWMERKGYQDLGQLRGAMSQQNVVEPAAFERANYIKQLEGYTAK